MYSYTTGILSRTFLLTCIQMNVLFILMLYDGGKRSTLTKYGTCLLQSRNNQQQEGKKRPIRCDHDLVLR